MKKNPQMAYDDMTEHTYQKWESYLRRTNYKTDKNTFSHRAMALQCRPQLTTL